MTRYIVEVFSTKNIETGVVRYYKMVLGQARRISKSDWEKLEIECDGLDSYSTVSTKTYIKEFKTLSFYM